MPHLPSSPLHHPKSGSFLPLQLHSKNGMSPEYGFRRFHVVFLGFPPFSVGFDRLRATWLIHDETQIEFVSAGPQLHSLMSAFDPKQTLRGCLLPLLELLSDRLEHVSLGAELNKARVHKGCSIHALEPVRSEFEGSL